MRYLGGISGSGMLRRNGEEIARVSYDFDGFFRQPVGIVCCGEIRLPAIALTRVFGRRDIQLLTDDGRLLDLSFSEKAPLEAGGAAHVDVTGDLPATPQSWRH